MTEDVHHRHRPAHGGHRSSGPRHPRPSQGTAAERGQKSQYDLLLLIEGRLDRLERNQDEHLRHHLKE
jgi:hypothetical protein